MGGFDTTEKFSREAKNPITPTSSGSLFWNRSKRLGLLVTCQTGCPNQDSRSAASQYMLASPYHCCTVCWQCAGQFVSNSCCVVTEELLRDALIGRSIFWGSSP
jgi:hypothetical protein